MNEILQVKHSLKRLFISYQDCDQCNLFDFDEFLTFIKAQRQGFSIILAKISNAGIMELFFSELIHYLDRKLKRDKRQARSHVTVWFGNSRNTWHVPLHNDNYHVL
uniref:TIR domain-containing protein n=1 Tax=Panagrellus redivivus TaxID=6233 RepID=A0A7E4URM2_PANRE